VSESVSGQRLRKRLSDGVIVGCRIVLFPSEVLDIRTRYQHNHGSRLPWGSGGCRDLHV